MRRSSAQLQTDRRAEILAAAERCFSKSGFHQTSMQEICAAAGMSPGNLYRYFPSKEAIIAGISERNRSEAAANMAAVSKAPDFFTGFAALGRHYLVERSDDEIALCLEIMAESRRNPEIGRIYQTIEKEVSGGLTALLRTAAERGEIPDNPEFEKIVSILLAIGDGIEWRRSVDPTFKPEAVFPMILDIVRFMLFDRPQAEAKGETK